MRWLHPVHGMMRTIEFIALAELFVDDYGTRYSSLS